MLLRTRRALLTAAPLAAGTLRTAALLRKPTALAGEDEDMVARLTPSGPPRPLPPFSFKNAYGRTLTLADYAGQGVVMNFWATWCHPCVAEMPSLNKLARMLKKERIAVLAVSSDQGGPDKVRRFYEEHQIDALDVLLDKGMVAGHILGLRGIPTTLLVDNVGREITRVEGDANWESINLLTILKLIMK